jgi:hypothetical protein
MGGQKAGRHHRNAPWSETDWGNWTVRVWKPPRDKLGGTEPPYGLRHSYASLRIRQGGSITELAEELGHSPQMTLNTYAHVIDELGGGRGCLPRRRLSAPGKPWPSDASTAWARVRRMSADRRPPGPGSVRTTHRWFSRTESVAAFDRRAERRRAGGTVDLARSSVENGSSGPA